MTPLLRAAGLRKAFRRPDGGEVLILDDIALEAGSGEVICLLGASGCGKSTLLRILAGLDADFGGEVTRAVPCPGPGLGYLAQDDRIVPWRSALGNVALGLELTGLSKAVAKTAARVALDQVGLGAYAAHNPSQLSGGMQQRVLLARLLALRPQLLLLDEPTGSLDIRARRAMAAMLKAYVRECRVAALIVTHAVEEACFLADRILIVTPAPARISREIRLTDDTASANDGAVPRDHALDIVMHALLTALGESA
jgi:ABC-type nitrate/sulfonate/bicarbonate transport system ATPase subunit